VDELEESRPFSVKLLRTGVWYIVCFFCSLCILVVCQSKIVGQFQKQMDPSENS